MRKIITLLTVAILIPIFSYAQDWNSTPYNWKNSPDNWENSPDNWNNSPYNWDNSPYNLESDRIIRDEDGNAIGYGVPRDDGGMNYYDFEGRWGYQPGDEDW